VRARRCAVVLGFACLAVIAAARPASAQGFLDRGTFLIERAGNEVGREDFAIQLAPARAGAGSILAMATVHYRDRELRPALNLSGDLQPVSHQLDVSSAGRVVERFSVQFGRGRIGVRMASQQHEVLREFPAEPGIAVLDDDVFHQFYFLPRAASGGVLSLRLLLPRIQAIVGGTVRRIGADTVSVGGRSIPADRFTLLLDTGEERDFWFTASGDLLRVAIPSREIVATRTAPPPR
jgi:hypothetical protein